MKDCVFPQGWIEQLTPLLGSRLPDFLHSMDLPPQRGIRMRPGREAIGEAKERVPWAERGYYLPLDSLAGSAPAHEAGAYYLQEPSAMAAAAALHPLPGDRVLDLCAAPGGKSTQLAAYMEGRGVLVCNEPVPARAQILSRNVERMGIANAVVVSALPEQLSPRWPCFFDRILVDAPCSGEGMFRRHPETRQEWRPTSPAGCAQRQRQILDHAALMLRPGGTLAYSTCTFNTTENEEVIQGFLQAHPQFSLLPIVLPGLSQGEGMVRLWPHLIRGEGHFVALLRKDEAAQDRRTRPAASFPAPGKGEREIARAFLEEHVEESWQPNTLFVGRVVQAPDGAPPLNGVRVLRLGLHLGESRGHVFLPDHALALASTPRRALPVDDRQAAAFQQGQVLMVSENIKGFYTPVLEGLPLGWGKASCGQLKNHYPKGLRR